MQDGNAYMTLTTCQSGCRGLTGVGAGPSVFLAGAADGAVSGQSEPFNPPSQRVLGWLGGGRAAAGTLGRGTTAGSTSFLISTHSRASHRINRRHKPHRSPAAGAGDADYNRTPFFPNVGYLVPCTIICIQGNFCTFGPPTPVPQSSPPRVFRRRLWATTTCPPSPLTSKLHHIAGWCIGHTLAKASSSHAATPYPLGLRIAHCAVVCPPHHEASANTSPIILARAASKLTLSFFVRY